MGKSFGGSSLGKTILVLCLSFMMVFAPVVAGAAPVIAAGGLGGGKSAANGLFGKTATYFSSLFKGARHGDYDFEAEFAAMDKAGKFTDINNSWQNFSAAALEDGQLAAVFEETVVRLSADEDISTLDELLLRILEDDELAIAIGEFIGGLLQDEEVMGFAEILATDAVELFQDPDFNTFLKNLLEFALVDGGTGILLDPMFLGILGYVDTFAKTFLDQIEYQEFLDGLLEVAVDPFKEYFEGFMDDPDIKATLDRILGNFEGIADDFLTELLEAEAFEKVLDGLLAVFLDPVMEHIVDDLVGKFADPNPDLIENPDAVPGHPLLGALLTNIMDYLKASMGTACGECPECTDENDETECSVNIPLPTWVLVTDLLDALMDELNFGPDSDGWEGGISEKGALTKLMDQVNLLLDAFMATAISIGGGGEEAAWECPYSEPGCTEETPCPGCLDDMANAEEGGTDPLEALLGIDELVDKIMGFVGLGDDTSGSLLHHLPLILEEYLDEDNPDGLKPYLDVYFKYDEEADPPMTNYLGNIGRTASASVSAALDTLLDDTGDFYALLKANNFVVTDEETLEESLGLGRMDDIMNLVSDKIKTEMAKPEPCGLESCTACGADPADPDNCPAKSAPCGLSTCPACGADPTDPDNCPNPWTADGRLTVALANAMDNFPLEGEKDAEGNLVGDAGLMDLINDHLDIFISVLLDHIKGEEEEGEEKLFEIIPWNSIADLLDADKVANLVDSIFTMLEDLDINKIFTDLKTNMGGIIQIADPDADYFCGCAFHRGECEVDPDVPCGECSWCLGEPCIYEGWVNADKIGHSLVKGILDGVVDGIRDPEPAEVCPDCELLPEGELCPTCQAAKDKAEARDAAIQARKDVLLGEGPLKTLYAALGGKYTTGQVDANGDPLYPFEKEGFEPGIASVALAVVMEILNRDDWPCGECAGCLGAGPCESPVNRLDAFMDELKADLDVIMEDTDVLNYGQRIAGAALGVMDRVVAPMLKLLYPRFYVHEYDEDQHAMYQQIFDEDYIGSSLWRIGSSLGGLLTDTMVYDFPDSVLYKFLNKYQVVEDIANPGFFNALTSFIGDMMNDEEIKVLKAGYFAEDIKDTIANVHTDLKDDFLTKNAGEFATTINDLLHGFFPEEPLVIKLYDEPCGECAGCLAALAVPRDPTYDDCEKFQPCGDCDGCNADPKEPCVNQWKTPADTVDSLSETASGLGDTIHELIDGFLEYETLEKITEAPAAALGTMDARCGKCAGCTADPQTDCLDPVNIRTGFDEIVEFATLPAITLVSDILGAQDGTDYLLQNIIDELLADLLAENGPVDGILTDVGVILNDAVTGTALKQLIVDIILFNGNVPCGDDACPFCGDPETALEECPAPEVRSLLGDVNTLLTDILSDTDLLDLVVYMLEDAIIEAAYGPEAYPLTTAYVEIAGIGLVPVSPEQLRTGIFNGLWAFFELLREWLIDGFQVMDEDTGLLSAVDFGSLPEGHPFYDGYVSLAEFIDGFLANFLTEARIRSYIANPAIDTVLGIGGDLFTSAAPSLRGIIETRITESMYADSQNKGPIALISELIAGQAYEGSDLDLLLDSLLKKVLDLVGDITATIDKNEYLIKQVDCGTCSGCLAATGCTAPLTEGLLYEIIMAASQIAPDAASIEQFINDNKADLVTIVEAIAIEIDLEDLKTLLTVDADFSQMLLDIVTGTRVDNIFGRLGAFIFDDVNEDLADSRGYKLGKMIQDLPGQFISSLLNDTALGDGASEIIAEKLVKEEGQYNIGKRVLDVVKLVASNENTAAILGDLLADGVRSLNNLFFGRIDPLGGFQKIMNPAPGEIIGGEVDSPYDAQMLQAMPTLGISTILSAGGVEPRVQEDGGVQASEVTGDDIKDAVLEWVQNMGTDLLYDDRLAEVINVVLADLMGADGSKLGTTVQDGKELIAGIVGDQRVKDVLGKAIGDLLASPEMATHIDTLKVIITDLLGDETLVKEVIGIVTELMADPELGTFVNNLIKGDGISDGIVQFVLDLVTTVLDDLFVTDPTINNEVMTVVENLIVFLVEAVPGIIGDAIQDQADNIGGIAGDVVVDVLEFAPGFAAALIGDPAFDYNVDEFIKMVFDFLPGIINGAATDGDIFELLAASVSENVDLVSIGDALVGVINDFLKDETFNEQTMAPSFTYISEEAVRRADFRTPGDTWNVIIAGARLNIMKLIAGILSGLPGDIITTVLLNWVIYDSGEPCGACENCMAGDPLDCTAPVGADPKVDPDKPLDLGTIEDWVGDAIAAVDAFRTDPENEKLLYALLDRAGGFVGEFVPLLLAETWACGECADCTADPATECQVKVTILEALEKQLLALPFDQVAADIAANDLYMDCGICDNCIDDDEMTECLAPIYIPTRLVEVVFGADAARTDFLDLLAEVALIIKDEGALEPGELSLVDLLKKIASEVSQLIPLAEVAGYIANDTSLVPNINAAIPDIGQLLADIGGEIAAEQDAIVAILGQLSNFPADKFAAFLQEEKDYGDGKGLRSRGSWIGENLSAILLGSASDLITEQRLTDVIIRALFDPVDGFLYMDGSPGKTLLMLLADWMESGGMYDFLDEMLRPEPEPGEIVGGSVKETASSFFSDALVGAFNWMVDKVSNMTYVESSEGAGIGLQADGDAVDIPDDKLRSAIEFALILNGVEGDLTEGDLKNLRGLSAVGRGITDLTGLEFAVNLEYLDLYGNEIEDLSPLSGLTNLESLSLGYNPIADISCLSALNLLTDLDLSHCGLSDISTISAANMPNLANLKLAGNEITSVASLAGYTGLKRLYLSDNQISSVTALSGLTGLERLYLANNTVSDITDLAGLTAMRNLDLANNGITLGFNALSGMTVMENLDLSGNGVNGQLGNLAGMDQLRRLYLSGSSLADADLVPIKTRTTLWELDLSDNGIVNLGDLTDLNVLRTLDLSGNAGLAGLATLADLVVLKDLRLAGANVTAAKLADITALNTVKYLDLSGNTGLALTGSDWSAMTALRRLDLSDNGTGNDLAPLAAGGLMLEELKLNNNNITDISDLAGVTFIDLMQGIKLMLTILPDMSFDSIAFLGREVGGGSLYLGGNSVTNVSPLEGKKFHVLDLSGNGLSNIGPIVNIEFGSYMGGGILDLSDNAITGLADWIDPTVNTFHQQALYGPYESLKTLDILYLSGNNMGDVSSYLREWRRAPGLGCDAHKTWSVIHMLEEAQCFIKVDAATPGEVVGGEAKAPISGKVTDVNGNALAGVGVTIQGEELQTGADGLFASAAVGEGEYTVEFRQAGYLPRQLTVNLDAGEISLQEEESIKDIGDVILELYGDISNDGKVDVADAIAVMQHIVGLKTLDADAELRAMVSGKDAVTVSDAILILKKIVNLLSRFPAAA